MKRVSIAIVVALVLAISIIAVVALRKRGVVDLQAIPPVAIRTERPSFEVSDQTVYRLNLCDLVHSGDRYNGKFVSMQVVYAQGKDTAALIDHRCEDAWVRPACYVDDKSCDEIWKPLDDVLLNGTSWLIRIDVVGLYISDIVDPNPLQGGNHVHMLQVTSLKNPVAQKPPL